MQLRLPLLSATVLATSLLGSVRELPLATTEGPFQATPEQPVRFSFEAPSSGLLTVAVRNSNPEELPDFFLFAGETATVQELRIHDPSAFLDSAINLAMTPDQDLGSDFAAEQTLVQIPRAGNYTVMVGAYDAGTFRLTAGFLGSDFVAFVPPVPEVIRLEPGEVSSQKLGEGELVVFELVGPARPSLFVASALANGDVQMRVETFPDDGTPGTSVIIDQDIGADPGNEAVSLPVGPGSQVRLHVEARAILSFRLFTQFIALPKDFSSPPPPTDEDEAPESPILPHASLETLDGESVAFHPARSGRIVLEVWDSTTVDAGIPADFAEWLASNEPDTEWIAVNRAESAEVVARIAADLPEGARVLRDPDGTFSRALGVTTLPCLLIIEDGVVLDRISGRTADRSNLIRDLLRLNRRPQSTSN